MVNRYQTRDLGLAAAIVVCGQEVIDFRPFNDNAFTFVLDVSFSEGKSFESDYYSSRLTVPALDYNMAVRNLKARIGDELAKKDAA